MIAVMLLAGGGVYFGYIGGKHRGYSEGFGKCVEFTEGILKEKFGLERINVPFNAKTVTVSKMESTYKTHIQNIFNQMPIPVPVDENKRK